MGGKTEAQSGLGWKGHFLLDQRIQVIEVNLTLLDSVRYICDFNLNNEWFKISLEVYRILLGGMDL